MDDHHLAQHFREVTNRLHRKLDELTATAGSAHPPIARPQQISGLLAELRHTGEWLRFLSAGPPPALQEELGNYRKVVERLRDLLPYVHAALLAERDRIERERFRVESAAQWAGRSRETL